MQAANLRNKCLFPSVVKNENDVMKMPELSLKNDLSNQYDMNCGTEITSYMFSICEHRSQNVLVKFKSI